MTPDNNLTSAIAKWLATTAAALDADRAALLSTAFLMPGNEVTVAIKLRQGVAILQADIDGARIELHRERIAALLLRPPISPSLPTSFPARYRRRSRDRAKAD